MRLVFSLALMLLSDKTWRRNEKQIRFHIGVCLTNNRFIPLIKSEPVDPIITYHAVDQFCYCGRPDFIDKDLVACDQCDHWMHTSCKGIQEKSSINDSYICNSCSHQND